MGCAASRAAFPPDGQQLIENDAHPWIEEHILGSMTYRKFRSPQKRFNNKVSKFRGSLAVTDKRVLGYAYTKRQVNVAFDDARIQHMTFYSQGDNKLNIKLDANLFHPTWSGEIECSFTTPRAQEFASRINMEISSRHSDTYDDDVKIDIKY